MTPFLTLATARAPDGAALTLHQRGKDYFLRVNGQALMATNAVRSEGVLAELACARLAKAAAARVLIGGLGFGFSLRRVLELVLPQAMVHVAELLPEVVAWNREYLWEVNGALLDDPRVKVKVEDVWETLSQAGPSAYDAILLDVDNGPMAMVQQGNGRLYHAAGLALIRQVLHPQGRVAFWSASPDAAFAKQLVKAGFRVTISATESHAHARRKDHTIFTAERG